MTAAQWGKDPVTMLRFITAGRLFSCNHCGGLWELTDNTWTFLPGQELRPCCDNAELSLDGELQLPGRQVSPRKLQLFAVACCRAAWHLLTDAVPCGRCGGKGHFGTDPGRVARPCHDCSGTGRINRSHQAVEVAERYADGLATEGELLQASAGAALASQENSLMFTPAWASPSNIVGWLDALLRRYSRGWKDMDFQFHAALLSDIVGNPFRPVTLEQAFPANRGPILWQAHWRHTVQPMAHAAYDDRRRICKCKNSCCIYCDGTGRWEGSWWSDNTFCTRCNGTGRSNLPNCPDCQGTGYIDNGTLDPERLAVLHDALEDAGCTDEAVLAHCKEPLHVRGCWVLDLILGRS